MQIGEVIRKYRKEKNMTQEEMARRLGVTAPAVNKWENNVSLPDITLLAPIARLLDISLDILLSFKEALTSEEISAIVLEADERLKKDTYEEVFQWVKEKIQTYPNCKQLIWQLAVILDARRMTKDIPDASKYNKYILECYERVLDSEEENIRVQAADSLFGYYVRDEQYEKAEEYLSYYSEQNPERMRKQAVIYSKTNRTDEAYKTYEHLLFSNYQMLSLILNSIYHLALQDDDMDKAHMLVNKQRELAKVFEMGRYQEVSCGLELATIEKDVEKTVAIMKEMLESFDDISGFRKSILYEHMKFKESRKEFIDEMKANLINCFKDEETYGYLKENEWWKGLFVVS